MDEVDGPGPDSSLATVALVVGTVSCLGGLLLAVIGPYRTAGVLVADLVVAIWTAVAFRGAGRERQAVAGVLVLAGLAGAEALLFLPALRLAGLAMLVGVAGAGATLLFRDRPVRILSSDLAIAGLAAASAAALPASRTTLAGTVGVAATFALIIGVLLGRWCVRRLPERSRAAGATLALAAALLLPLGVLAVFAIDIRRGGGYIKAYGTPVTVEVGSTCRYQQTLKHGIPVDRSNPSCAALWRVEPDGDLVRGRVVAEWAQVQPGREIPAYALGERAFTPALSDGVEYAPLGRFLPLWVTLALPLGLVAGGWLLVRAARAFVPTAPPPPTIGPSPWS